MKNKFFLLLLSIIFYSNVFCQQNKFDEINAKIKYNDSISRGVGDYELLIKSNLETYKVSKKKGYKKGEVLSLLNVSSGLWNKGDSKSCIKILTELEKDDYVINDEYLYIKVCQEFAQCYANLKLYKVALDYHFKVMRLVKSSKKLTKKEINQILNYSYGSLAFIHEQNESIDSSFYYNQKALKIKRTVLILSNVANLHAKMNRIDSLAFYVSEAKLELEKGKQTLLHKLVFKRVNGIYLYKIKKYDEAENSLQESLSMAKKLKRHNAIFFSYKALINYYNEVPNYSKSTKYQKDFNRFIDSSETIRNSYTNYAVEELLKKKDEQLINVSKKSNHFLFIILSSILLLVIVGYFYFKNRKSLREKLNEIQNKELENLKLKESQDQSYINLIEALKNNDGSFIILFEKKYENFYKKLIIKHPNLTKTELILCALIRLNLTSKEIAEYTYVQHKTVQTQKNRLRKKLDISSEVNLYNYFNNEF